MQISLRPSFQLNMRQTGRSLLLVFVVFYLGFHAVSGDRGVISWLRESRKLETLNAELASLKAEREAFEKRVKLLSSNSIDPDMLDEEARKTLGLAKPDEVVILLPKVDAK